MTLSLIFFIIIVIAASSYVDFDIIIKSNNNLSMLDSSLNYVKVNMTNISIYNSLTI